MLHDETLRPGLQSHNVIFYFKSKKGQFVFARTSLPMESKGESRAARLVAGDVKLGMMLLHLASHQRGTCSVNFTSY